MVFVRPGRRAVLIIEHHQANAEIPNTEIPNTEIRSDQRKELDGNSDLGVTGSGLGVAVLDPGGSGDTVVDLKSHRCGEDIECMELRPGDESGGERGGLIAVLLRRAP